MSKGAKDWLAIMARQHQRQLFDVGSLTSLGPFVVLSEPNPEDELKRVGFWAIMLS